MVHMKYLFFIFGVVIGASSPHFESSSGEIVIASPQSNAEHPEGQVGSAFHLSDPIPVPWSVPMPNIGF